MRQQRFKVGHDLTCSPPAIYISADGHRFIFSDIIEARQFMLEIVSAVGWHAGPNLHLAELKPEYVLGYQASPLPEPL